MKIHKNQTLQFSSIFMTPGTWKFTKIRRFNFYEFTKIRRFDFLQFSWPRVHENSQKSDTLIFINFHDPGYIEIHKNQTHTFSSILMKINRGLLKLFSPLIHNICKRTFPGCSPADTIPAHLFSPVRLNVFSSYKTLRLNIYSLER